MHCACPVSLVRAHQHVIYSFGGPEPSSNHVEDTSRILAPCQLVGMCILLLAWVVYALQWHAPCQASGIGRRRDSLALLSNAPQRNQDRWLSQARLRVAAKSGGAADQVPSSTQVANPPRCSRQSAEPTVRWLCGELVRQTDLNKCGHAVVS